MKKLAVFTMILFLMAGKSDRSHVVLWAKELVECFVFLRPLGLRLKGYHVKQIKELVEKEYKR